MRAFEFLGGCGCLQLAKSERRLEEQEKSMQQHLESVGGAATEMDLGRLQSLLRQAKEASEGRYRSPAYHHRGNTLSLRRQ